MLKKIMKMRIQKRLTYSSLIAIGISAVASLFAIFVVIFMVGKYDHVLTYYAFPQGISGMPWRLCRRYRVLPAGQSDMKARQ